MIEVEDEYQQLESKLARTPIIGDIHPLLPLAMSSSVRIVKSADDVICEMDDVYLTPHSPMLILNTDARLTVRFPSVSLKAHPPIEAINKNLHFHLDYAREHLLTTLGISAALVNDVSNNRYEIVVFLLVDGLSYGDVVGWLDTAIPCFVDGPTVTFRLSEDQSTVLPNIGFPSIIGSPSVVSQLYSLGYKNALGYTYWAPESNLISDHLFRQIPTHQVANFEAILSELNSFKFKSPTYIQIMREGLDGLAHSKREVSRTEVVGSISAIRQDIERLLQVLEKHRRSVCLFLAADHGILWKTEHSWRPLELMGSKPRYSTTRPDDAFKDHSVRYERDGHVFYSLIYPFLGSRIKADDSGVHGGLSYEESIVPFVKFEVR